MGEAVFGAVEQAAAAEVVEQGDAVARRCRGKLGKAGLVREAGDPEVAAMHLEEGGGLFRYRVLVVPHVGTVRSPDLD